MELHAEIQENHTVERLVRWRTSFNLIAAVVVLATLLEFGAFVALASMHRTPPVWFIVVCLAILYMALWNLSRVTHYRGDQQRLLDNVISLRTGEPVPILSRGDTAPGNGNGSEAPFRR